MRVMPLLVIMLAVVVVSAYVVDFVASAGLLILTIFSSSGFPVAGDLLTIARATAATALGMLVAAILLAMVFMLAYSLRADRSSGGGGGK